MLYAKDARPDGITSFVNEPAQGSLGARFDANELMPWHWRLPKARKSSARKSINLVCYCRPGFLILEVVMSEHPALLVSRLEDGKVRCMLRAHKCLIRPGQKGICRVRENRDGSLLV